MTTIEANGKQRLRARLPAMPSALSGLRQGLLCDCRPGRDIAPSFGLIVCPVFRDIKGGNLPNAVVQGVRRPTSVHKRSHAQRNQTPLRVETLNCRVHGKPCMLGLYGFYDDCRKEAAPPARTPGGFSLRHGAILA
jgi:hypothetical protein